MFLQSNLEEEIIRKEKKLAALVIEFERLNSSVESLLGDMALTEESVSHFCNTRENFDNDTWLKLEEEREKLNQKFQLQLNQVKDTRQTQKKYDEMRIAPHWLFVR